MRVIVIGGGIVGTSAAYHLSRRGVSVTLVDAAERGQATAAGAGIVFPWPFPWDPEPVRAFSFAAAAHYPLLMADLAADGGDPGYDVVGGLSVSGSEPGLDQEHAMLGRLGAQPGYEGMGDVARLPAGEPARRFPVLPEHYSGVSVAGMARLDGRMARDALFNAAEERGMRHRTGAAELLAGSGGVRGVRVDGEDLPADAVIVAAGAWTARLLAPFDVAVPVHPVRGQITHLALPGHRTADWPVVRFSDRDQYMLTFGPNRLVLSGTREPEAGFDHRVTAAGLREVLDAGLDAAPGAADGTVLETRVGFRPGSSDGLPILGTPRHLPGVVVATGLGASGLTFGPYQGALAAGLAVGEAPGFDIEDFRPDREPAAPEAP
ncbi:D-amino-acid dehydrogenase [Murinocardiopsis flavida]|uniref:D-amino-acid dehydrogenase n=1 Tax=Murinocardiopsis flavida TaxID=645275 RepID=A0A2P8CF57_9ACTN|nr:FAD-binding oxidoreductase [Murinocardiopsis flavida]PSK83582.1 D-amino-acid dehydrogenase [Murinocardiopsis flavida]